MDFTDVVAQERVKGILLRQADGGRLPHAVMLHGPEGAGKLALALALSRYLLCEGQKAEGRPCEDCPSCHMTKVWAHPDLHFSFPVIKRKSTDQPISDDFLPQWREQIDHSPYFTQGQWLARIDAQNQQMAHFVGESESLWHKLSIKPARGGCRVIIVWLPERMMEPCANKLLKLIEEPPPRTHFLMVSEQPDLVLGTIVSRAQPVHVPPLSEAEISKALRERRGLESDEADHIAHLAQGSFTKALAQTEDSDSDAFQLFVSLMRLAYSRKIKDMASWSEQMARLGREAQKQTLQYFQHMVRESFVRNFPSHSQLNYMTREEEAFVERFAPFVNSHNVQSITDELAHCQSDIEQNVNARMVFFDFIIKLTILLKRK